MKKTSLERKIWKEQQVIDFALARAEYEHDTAAAVARIPILRAQRLARAAAAAEKSLRNKNPFSLPR
jgi:hypothetical protein